MAKLLKVAIFFSFLFITSCSLDEELLALEGEWKLTSISGGFTGAGMLFEDDITMNIDGDDLTVFLDEEKVLEADLCYEEGEPYDVIEMDGDCRDESVSLIFGFSGEYEVYKQENSLTFSDIYRDCYNFHFTKI